ncbi:MAG: IS1595 family transposase [Saprospiraceae bacterium]|nr:IS1595 family transposase [Saprospiraceae bacterium]
MNFNFKTLSEFNDYFNSELVCYQFLESQRWDNKPVCPHCAFEKYYTVKSRGKFKDIPSYRCANRKCDLPFTVRTGSIFEGSKVELRKWFQAVYEITTCKKGISSVELGTRIGVSQKTSWQMSHKVRTLLADSSPDLLEGIIESDEVYIGGKNKNRHKDKKIPNSQGRSAKDKTPVIGLVERGGKVMTFVAQNTDSETLHQIIDNNVVDGATIVTDSYKSYYGIGATYNHIVVKHEDGGYVTYEGDNQFHTQNIENFWSQLKRGYIGIYHYMSPQHLHRYCNEFAARYNHRSKSNIDRFMHVIENCSVPKITYSDLTKKDIA